jgi:hypothetical protein
VVPKPSDDPNDPLKWIKLRVSATEFDDTYKLLEPVPLWVLQGHPLFTQMAAWNRMTIKQPKPHQRRGIVTFIGFRRPDQLAKFKKVTIMSALFKDTINYAVWSQLGVNFQPSEDININTQTTNLGQRKLRIYWLYDDGWSKSARDRSGGIFTVFKLIKAAGVIAEENPVCVLMNKDDDNAETNARLVKEFFPNVVPLPPNTRGQNQYRIHHQLIHIAALNAYTSDIRWMEEVMGIDSPRQRIARTGQEIYQTIMRLSIRDPDATEDITVVVMDKDVAEWLVQWFEPAEQVEVIEIDSSGELKRRGKTGRPRIGNEAMSARDRMRKMRAQRRLKGWQPE